MKRPAGPFGCGRQERASLSVTPWASATVWKAWES